MAFALRVQARPRDDVPVEQLHERLLAALGELAPPWRPERLTTMPVFGRNDFTAQVSLTRKLGPGLKGFVNYRMRSGLADDSSDDDFLDAGFNPEKIDLAYVAETVLPRLVTAMGAYRAYVEDEAFYEIDYERTLYTNGRRQVTRLRPVDFFDAELCRRAFALTPATVLARVESHVARAALHDTGVWLMASPAPLTVDEAEQVDRTLAAVLDQPR